MTKMKGESLCTRTHQCLTAIKEENSRESEERGTGVSDTHSGNPEVPENSTNLTSDTSTSFATYTCMRCSKSFSSPSHLALHVCTRRYRCRKITCSKVFSRPSQLVGHMTVHMGEKPFKCPDCGRAFGRVSHLDTHRRLHTGEKPFRCVVCAKSFTQKSGLIVHIRKHTGERPYKCHNCSQGFRTAANLLNHQAVEAGEGRHTCAKCSQSFRNISALRQHEKFHWKEGETHNAPKHTCTVCHDAFTFPPDIKPSVYIFHCRVCSVIFTDMATFKNHCEEHKRVESFYVDDDELEDEEDEVVVTRKNSTCDPPFRPHVATSATRYMSDISTRSRTRALSSTEGFD